MASPRLLLMLALGSFGSCGEGPATAASDGALRVVATCSHDALTASLRANSAATLVLSLGGDQAATLAAAAAAGRSQPPFLVTVGGRPGSGSLPDALVEAPSGADVAVDLALLACAGAPPPPTTYSIGARTWDAANRAAGGAPTLAPADVIIAMLRQQRADVLTARPPQGARHRIAFVAVADDHAAQRAEVRDAAAKYQHVELVEAGSAADAVAAGAESLILATDDPRVTRAALATAASVVVLDPMLQDAPGACRIGCAPETAARAAVARIRALLPEGGDLIVCGPDGDDAWAQATRDAIVTALGIAPASVR